MTANLAEIAADVRQKSPTTKNEVNQYDAIEKQIALRIAGGIMPYKNTNSIKRIKQKPVGVFEGLSIWYSHDLSPNAPRIYFTVKKMGELLIAEDPRIDHAAHGVVILAESDKANQVSVLQVLTGGSHRAIRRGGAGSV